jgi:hypothetical protein
MIKQNPFQNLAARPRARGVASKQSRILLILAGWLAMVTPLRADNPSRYLFQIDSAAVLQLAL